MRRKFKQKETNNMKSSYAVMISFIGLFIIGISPQIFSQEEQRATAGAPKRISAEDKAAIKEIFKGVNPSKYRLEFDGGKDTMGSKKVSMADIKQVQSVEHPSGNDAARVVFIAKDRGVMFCFKVTVNRRVLEGQLGKEKLARLDQIMAKYSR
jgi:hypothetical protein